MKDGKIRALFSAGVFSGTEDGKRVEGVSIRVEDKSSGVVFLELTVSLYDFAKATFGNMGCEVDGQVRGLNLVGTRCENKTIQVILGSIDEGVIHYWHDEKLFVKRLRRLAKAEGALEGGWRVYTDGFNINKLVKKGDSYCYPCNLYRFVVPETGEVVTP